MTGEAWAIIAFGVAGFGGWALAAVLAIRQSGLKDQIGDHRVAATTADRDLKDKDAELERRADRIRALETALAEANAQPPPSHKNAPPGTGRDRLTGMFAPQVPDPAD